MKNTKKKIKVHTLQAQKAADRRTGLLGLAADRSTETGDCLTSEEMALLVEKKYTHQKEQQFFDHIAHCLNCYEEWLVLRKQVVKEEDSQTKEKKSALLSFLFRPRNLAVFGSALAAAASIAIVLNIPFDQQRMASDEAVLWELKEGVAVKKDGGEFDGKQSKELVSALKKAEQQPVPSPKPVGRQVQKIGEVKQVAVDKETVDFPVQGPKRKFSIAEVEREKSIQVIENRNSTAPATLLKSRSVERDMLDEGAKVPQSTGTGAALVDDAVISQTDTRARKIDDWLQKVKNGCTKRKSAVLFWERLVEDGHELKNNRSAEIQSDEQFIKVLDFVTRMDEKKRERMCSEILQILHSPK